MKKGARPSDFMARAIHGFPGSDRENMKQNWTHSENLETACKKESPESFHARSGVEV